MRKVHDNVYRLFAGLTANQYLIVEPEGLTLIDTGLPGSHRLVMHFIRLLGYRSSDLKRILITHADVDHCGALAGFRRTTRARVYASPAASGCIQAGRMPRQIGVRTFQGRLFRFAGGLFPFQAGTVDQALVEGDVLPVLGGLTVLETPGHTPDHLSFFAARDRILFGGDSIYAGRHGISYYKGDTTLDPALAHRSFERQLALQPALICAGHSFTRAA